MKARTVILSIVTAEDHKHRRLDRHDVDGYRAFEAECLRDGYVFAYSALEGDYIDAWYVRWDS